VVIFTRPEEWVVAGAGTNVAGAGSAAELEAEIERTRAQLAQTIDQIAERVSPKNVAEKTKARARDIVVNPDGTLRKERVRVIGGVAFAFIAIVMWRRFH
jgi:hypothetical protein